MRFITITVMVIFVVLLFLTWNRKQSLLRERPEEESAAPRQSIVLVKELPPPDKLQQPPAKAVQKELPAGTPVRGGLLIAMQADYRSHLGFPAYVDAMKQRGGRFFIFDAGTDKLLAEVMLPGDSLSRIDPASLAGLSPRVREISGEIAVSAVLDKAKEKLGTGYHKVIMLLPDSMEQHLDHSLRQRLAASGQNPTQVNRIEGEYMDWDGGLCFSTRCYYTDAGKHEWKTFIPF